MAQKTVKLSDDKEAVVHSPLAQDAALVSRMNVALQNFSIIGMTDEQGMDLIDAAVALSDLAVETLRQLPILDPFTVCGAASELFVDATAPLQKRTGKRSSASKPATP